MIPCREILVKVNSVDKNKGIYVFQLDEKNYINFCPKRGGILTNWVSDGKEILYFDEKRFIDKTKSIRGESQSYFRFVEILIYLILYLGKIICNLCNMVLQGICNGNTA